MDLRFELALGKLSSLKIFYVSVRTHSRLMRARSDSFAPPARFVVSKALSDSTLRGRWNNVPEMFYYPRHAGVHGVYGVYARALVSIVQYISNELTEVPRKLPVPRRDNIFNAFGHKNTIQRRGTRREFPRSRAARQTSPASRVDGVIIFSARRISVYDAATRSRYTYVTRQ